VTNYICIIFCVVQFSISPTINICHFPFTLSFQQKSRCILVFKNKAFYFRRAVEAVTIDLLNLFGICQPGVVAHACNPVTWRLGSLNGLRAGFLGMVVLCRSGVRAKFGVNMVNTEESEFSRLVKEKRTGPGWKHSRQKLPRQTVVG